MNNKVSTVTGRAGTVLRLLGAGTLVVGSLVVPNLASAIAPLLQKKAGLSRHDAERELRYAIKKNWVSYTESGDTVTLSLTKSGKSRLRTIEIGQRLSSCQWDNKWRMVIFDIPAKQRLKRDALRNHLKKVGFRQLQESVWITPHDCNDLILVLKNIYQLSNKEVRLIEATAFDGESAFIRLFDISK